MIFDIPLAIMHEMTARARISRTPETELVMNADQTVADYSVCGEENGALYGPYLYNAYQVSARIKGGQDVIDLGCGSGRLLNLIARWNPHVRFTGVDLAPQMLKQARQQAALMGLHNVTYCECDFSHLRDFEASSSDAVISSMALHHLPDRAALTRCFAGIDRVLRPGGAVYLMDFGRLRSRKALEIFVSKVAHTETASLSQDYRASLHAAFLPEDFRSEIATLIRPEISLKRTIVAPLAMIVCTPLSGRQVTPPVRDAYNKALNRLSPARRAELNQLKLFLRLGGMDFPS